MRTLHTLAFALVVALGIFSSFPVQARELVRETVGPASIEWQALIPWESVTLRVSGPEEIDYAQTFRRGEHLVFRTSSLPEAQLPDGGYSYELFFEPVLDGATRALLQQAREKDDRALIRQLRRSGRIPSEPQVHSGAFVLLNGAIVPGDLSESNGGTVASKSESGFSLGLRPSSVQADANTVRPFDQVIPDDLIVQGSICAGFDCVNNENFSFDTLRLKENNLRIKFDDTSTGSFPATDWQITANDSASGGLNKFAIEDITGARVPFTIVAGANTHSIFTASTGRVGFRTSTPVLDLHVNTSDTPALRLEQNNSGGFTGQTWDVAGNEANFFIRDVTGGSRLSLRIRPGAPTSSIDIGSSGDVGVGTASPNASLHVFRTSGNAGIKVEQFRDTSISTPRDLLTLINHGRAQIRLVNNATGSDYVFSGPGAALSTLSIYNGQDVTQTRVAVGSTAAASYTLDVFGDLRVSGTILGALKAGIIPASSFSGTPATATVIFSSPYPSTAYAVTLTPVSSTGSLVFNVSSKTASGFTVVGQSTAGLQEVNWMATRVTP